VSDLAKATGLSASRTTRAWPGLPPGHGQAEVRWTVHLASVRNRFFDHIDVTAVTQAANAFSAVADRLEDGSSAGTGWDREAFRRQATPPQLKGMHEWRFRAPRIGQYALLQQCTRLTIRALIVGRETVDNVRTCLATASGALIG